MFTITFGNVVVANVLTGDLVAAVAAKCPPGALLTVQHPTDSASVLIDPAASTREKNKLFASLKEWADGIQPTGPVIELEPVGPNPTSATPPPESDVASPTVSSAAGEVETHATCNGEQHELKTPVPKKTPEPDRVRVPVGSVVLYTATNRKYVAKVEHLLPPGGQIICATPHGDDDYSYQCPNPECQCNKVEEKV